MDKDSGKEQHREQEQQQDAAEDTYEDLCDVEATFPIDGQNCEESQVVSRDTDSRSEIDAMAASTNKLDEDATMRCFKLSVNAHMEGQDRVATFEPITSTPTHNGVTSATHSDNKNKANQRDKSSCKQKNIITKERIESNSKKGKWFPASLPLPSWALDPKI